ncbi:endonuclease/exonuclease/phosphatase family protein [Actinomadura flavalba]|uniref:endonuclease/exonuclease/phosphatase family protein n=1 Tax=Actinomadura flavalba TaxID=1120938 RepID=UPI000476DFA7|nr:endonuclease/exonuclease/phosphatase family protein [Actinomadura flavalba]
MRGAREAGAVLAAVMVTLPLAGTPASAGAPAAPRIRDVQGGGHVSPLAGRPVAGVTGVVTARDGTGFWMQDPAPDRDDATSEAVFVFDRTSARVAVGDAVRVDGRVGEYRAGPGAAAHLSRTEIDATAVAVTARGVPLPPPVVLGPGGRKAPPAVSPGPAHDVERRAFDVKRNAVDFYESLEGMRVRVVDAVAAGPSRWGEVPVLPAGGAGTRDRTARGGLLQRAGTPSPERVLLDDALAPLPAMNVGDRLPGANDGVLDYGRGDFRLLLTAAPRRQDGGLPRETARAQRPGELAIATLDLAGLHPDTPAERLLVLARDIAEGLAAPDLITIAGLQDNSGPADDGTTEADQSAAELITAISAVGGPAYDWRSIAPRDNADGGETGANPRLGFLFRTDRGLTFVDRPGAANAPVRAVPAGGGVRLSHSPGRVAPADPAWRETRKPVAGELTWRGRPLIVVAGQWYPAITDDQPAFGRHQPPARPSTARRDEQARVLAGFVNSVRAADRNAAVIVAGDLNEPGDGGPVKRLTGETGLRDLTGEVPEPRRYTSVAGGHARALDHILVSPPLAARRHETDIVHRTAEFADRAGERDPALVRIEAAP